jgi:hypothetical protein
MGHVNISHLIPATREEVFEYLCDLNAVPEQLEDMIQVEFKLPPPKLAMLTDFDVTMTRYNVTAKIICRVEQFSPPERIFYRQKGGFFKTWTHSMTLDEHGPKQTRLSELVHYTMPFGLIGFLVDDIYVRSDIERIMNERAGRIVDHFNKVALRNER